MAMAVSHQAQNAQAFSFTQMFAITACSKALRSFGSVVADTAISYSTHCAIHTPSSWKAIALIVILFINDLRSALKRNKFSHGIKKSSIYRYISFKFKYLEKQRQLTKAH